MDLAIRTYAFLLVAASDLKARLDDEDHGQTVVEYILVLAFVGLIAVALTTGGVIAKAKAELVAALASLFDTAAT